MNRGLTAASYAMLAACCVTAAALAPPGPVYDLSWFTIDGGGGTSVGGTYEMSGTIGQHDAGGPLTGGTYELYGGFWIAPAEVGGPEIICPDEAGDFLKSFGGPVTGDALDLCADDNVRLQVQQSAPVTPLLPFIRLEFWANTTLSGDTISQLDYHINCHVSAFVGGGQNPNTLRTSIRNFTANNWSLRDQRATPSNADVDIDIVESANAPDYVNAGDGMIRVRQDVFNPGNAAFPLWFLKVDQYEVTVTP